ncbi:MAG: autotransporter-associated beta strand repeat-containing protein, partial [Verrucomicrobia bacterium]|nr:autotransporter-associated beta strand repeat-containing protein [Verrucomicrobiota bacterium]
MKTRHPQCLGMPLALKQVVSGIVITLLTVTSGPVSAADYFWDNDTTGLNNVLSSGAGIGGAGIWNTSLNSFWTGNTLSGMSAWNNAGLDTAIFRGTAGTVTLGTGITVGGLRFDTTGFGISNGTNTLTFGGASNSIVLNSLANANATSTIAATLTGQLAGSGDVILSGGLAAGLVANTLTLNGTSTGGWSGATTLGVGQTMSLSANNQALLNTSAINLNGGAVILTNTNATEAALNRVNNSAGITSNGGTITVTNTASSSVNYSETLGGLTLGSGLLTVTQTNANTSPATQTLALGAIARTGGSANTSQLNFTGTSLGANTQNVITISGQSATTASIFPWMTYGGTDFAAYNGTNGVIAATATNLTASLVGAVGTDYNAATVTLGSNGSMRTLRFGGGTALTVTGAGTTSIGGIVSSGAAHVLAGGTAYQAITAGDNFFVNVGANQLTISAPIQNVGAGATASTLVLGGAGTLTLSGTNTFSGGIVLNSGTLQYTGSTAATLGNASNSITFNGSATLQALTTGGTTARNIVLNNGAIASFTNAAIAQTYSGNVTGTGGILINNTSGTATSFTGTGNTFTGPVQITSGTLTVGGTSALGNTNNPVNFANTAGVTLNLAGNLTVGSISGAGATGGTITLGANTLTFGGNNENTTYAGTLTGTGGAITKTGTGTTTLTGTNTFTGAVNLNGGLVNITALPAGGTNSALGTSGTIGFGGGGIQFGGVFDPSVRTLTFNAGGATFDTNGNPIVIASPVGNSGAGGLTKAGAGLLILNAANTYTGSTSVRNGVLRLGNNQALGTGSAGANVQSGGVLLLPGGISTGGTGAGGSLTLNGNGATAFATGALVSAGINTYAGALALGSSATVSVDGGTLNLTSTGAVTGTGDLTLAGSGTGNLSGAFANGAGGLVKTGSGTWNLTGTGGTNTGVLSISNGTLNLAGGALGSLSGTTLGGGTLNLTGGTQTFGNLNVAAGSFTAFNAAAGSTAAFGSSFTRGAGGVVAFDTSAAGSAITSAATAGTVLGYATIKDGTATGMAIADGTNIVRMTTFSGGILADNTNAPAGNFTTAGMAANPLLWSNGITTRAVNSLTFDASAGDQIVDMGAAGNVLTLTSGAIQKINGNNATLLGGQLGATNSEVIIQQNGTGSLILNSPISGGTGSLTALGSGTVVLGGANTFTGGVTIAGATLRLGNAAALRAPNAPSDFQIRFFGPVAAQTALGQNAVTFAAGSTGRLQLGGFNSSISSLSTNTASPGTPVVENASATAATLTLNPAIGTNNVFSGLIQDGTGGGALSLVKAGNGSITLTNAANSFTGRTVINQGTVTVTNNGALGTGTSTVAVNGIAGFGWTGGTLVLGGGDTPFTFTRNLSVAGRGFTAGSAGTAFTSVGANTIAGNLSGGFGSSEGRIYAAAGNTTFTGTVTPNGGGLFIGGAGNQIINGLVTGSATAVGIIKINNGAVASTLVLGNASNNFASTIRLDSGTLRVANGGALGQSISASAIEFNQGTLEVRTDSPGSFSTRNFSTITNNGTIFVDRAVDGSGLGTQVVSALGVPSYASASGNVLFGNYTNQRRILTINGRNGYGLTVNGATGAGTNAGIGSDASVTLVNSSNGVFTFDGTMTVGDGTARTLALNLQGNADSVMTGYFRAGTGVYNLAKSNQGTWVMTGTGVRSNTDSNFTGSTNITGGTLLLSGPSARIGGASGGILNGVAGGALQLNGGAFDYRGAGEVTAKTINQSGTTGNAIILANQTAGPLVFNTSAVGAGQAGAKTLFLGGTSTAANEIAGVIVGDGSVAKVGPGTWLYDPAASTYSTGAAPTWVSGGAANTNSFVVSSVANIGLGARVTGTSIPTGTVVTGINSATNTVTISNGITTALVAGTFTFADTSNFTGNLDIAGGTLQLRPTAATGSGSDIINNTSSVRFVTDALTGNGFAGGVLEFQGSAAAGTLTETAGALVSTAGLGTVRMVLNGGTPTLNFASLTAANRAVGATLRFEPTTAGGIQFAAVPTAVSNGALSNAYIVNPTTGAIDFVATPAINTNIAALGATTALPTATGSATANYLMSGNTTTTGAVAANTIRITGGNLALGGALTLTSAATGTSGGILQNNASGASTISGAQNINVSTANQELVIITGGTGTNANPLLTTNTLTISSVLNNGTGVVTKAGTGTLVLSGQNTFTGGLIVNEGVLRASGTNTQTLGAPAVGTVNVLRQNTFLDVNGAGASAAPFTGGVALSTLISAPINGAGSITSTAAGSQAIQLGTSASTSSGVFSGVISNGSGTLTVIRNGASGTQALTGLNTYTGPTILSGGAILQANTLANGGVASSIGASSNAAGNLVFNGGTLLYQGANATVYQTTQSPSISIDRLFTLAGNGTIQSSGTYGNQQVGTSTANSAALVFNNTGDIAFAGTGTRLLTLGGTSTGDNQISLRLTDNGASAFSLTKADAGLWVLGNNSNNYTGATTISAGQLRVTANGGSLTTGGNLTFNGGVLETSGTFTRAVGTGAGQVSWTGGTANGGFAASTAPLAVNLSTGTLTWGTTPGFLSTGTLLLNSTTALFDVDFQNAMNLNGATRTIQVLDNTTTNMDFATLSGVISGATAGSNLTLNAGAPLYVRGANTYIGNTTLSGAAAVAVTSIGAAGATATNFGTNVGGGALNLSNGAATGGYLLYYGAGETTTRPINLNTATGAPTIDASGSGALVVNNLVNNLAGAKTLNIRGMNYDPNTITSNLNDNGGALTVTKSDGGVWVLSGTNNFTGNLNISGGGLGVTSGAALGSAATGSVVISNGYLFGVGAPIVTSRALVLSVNANSEFTGNQSITFNGTVTGPDGSNTQVWNVINTIDGGTLTFNSNFINAEPTVGDAHPLVFGGTGATVWNGVIGNSSANAPTQLTLTGSNGSTLTLGGASANTYTGTTTLTQGTLILNKVGALGASTANFAANGGVLQAAIDLTGANRILNPIVPASNAAIFSGSNSMEFGGTVSVNLPSSRNFINNLDAGKSLIFSGNITNTAGATLTLVGSGAYSITGNVTTGTAATGLTYAGNGTLNLSGVNNATGAFTFNRGTTTLTGTTATQGTITAASGIVVNAGATLTLDNTTTNATGGRIPGRAVTLSGGTLNQIGNASGTLETAAGALTLNNGASVIGMTGTGTDSLTFASLAFGAGSSMDLNITGLGTSKTIVFTTAPTLLPATTGILPRVTVGGTDFATYSGGSLNALTGYIASINTAGVTNTVRLTTSETLNAFAATRNALVLNGPGITADSVNGSVLTLTAGGVLSSGAGTNTLSISNVALGATEGLFHVGAGNILNVQGGSTGRGGITGTGGLTKTLGGTLVFTADQYYTGTTTINAGTLQSTGLNKIFQNAALVVNPGGTFDLNNQVQFVGAVSSAGSVPGAGGTIALGTSG